MDRLNNGTSRVPGLTSYSPAGPGQLAGITEFSTRRPRPLISLILPVLNEAPILAEALSNLPSAPDLEIILVDGGSTDATREVAGGFPQVRWVSAPRGRGAQMNAGAREELTNFFDLGLESVISAEGLIACVVSYRSPEPGLIVIPARIRQTRRIMDDLVQRDHFRRPPSLDWLGDPQDKVTLTRIKDFFAAYRPRTAPPVNRTERPLPEVEVQYFPSNPRGHVVVRDTPIEAWKEILYLLTRFGRRVTLKTGDRLELQHVKVVVEQPECEQGQELHEVNIASEKLRRYQEDILRGELRPDETYNYGHRLRAYFGLDTLEACANRLLKDPEDRKSYVALWDTARDLTVKEGRPCLVSLFFRKFEDKLTLSATFRTHNAMDAWLLNVYGLMAVQKWLAERVGLDPGAIVVISHSLGLDPRELDRALMIIGKRPFKVNLDPMGYFRITLDGKEILVEHRFEDFTLKEYRGRTAVSLQHQIARDVAVSDINHAIYLGRQLAKAEMALKDGREFVQD